MENQGEKNSGSLSVRIGPMCSGKTIWLNSKLTRLADQGCKVLKIIYKDDLRYNNQLGTNHSSGSQVLSSKIGIIISSEELNKINVDKFEVIGLDESQFYFDLKSTVIHWVEDLGKKVKICGLDGDFDRNQFGQTLSLCPYSDKFKKMKAVCEYCLEKNKNSKRSIKKGIFSKRINREDKKQVSIGGKESYKPCCRKHYLKEY